MKLNSIQFLLVSLLSLTLSTSCKEDPEAINNIPTLRLDEPTELLRTSVTLHGSIITDFPDHIQEYGFLFGSTSDFSGNDTQHLIVKNRDFSDISYSLTNLQQGATYFYALYVSSGGPEMLSVVKSLTMPAKSAVTITDLIMLDAASATISATISDDGGGKVVSAGFCWSETPNPTIRSGNAIYASINADQTFSASLIEELQENTTYYIRAFADSEITDDGATTTSYSAEEISSDQSLIKPNEIRYTSIDDRIIEICDLYVVEVLQEKDPFGVNVVSNTYENGQGVITFETPLTQIKEMAFLFCDRLKTITFPAGIEEIGAWAFQDCVNLTNIILPKNVRKIGTASFSGCKSLERVYIPDQLNEIGDLAFSPCLNLKEFRGKYASEDRRCIIIDGELNSFAPGGLEEYSIPNQVTVIGTSAFSGCPLTNIIIPEGVTQIESSAFGSSLLTSLHIPSSVISIGAEIATSCCNLSQFSGNFASGDGRCLIFNGELNSFAPANLTEYTIPIEATTLGSNSFSHSCLTKITIHDNIKKIGWGAFQFSESLSEIDFGNANIEIEEQAFTNCYALKSVTIPNSVSAIHSGAFFYCSSLEAIYCESETPTEAIYSDGAWRAFDYIAYDGLIYVPDNAVEAYKNAPGWKEYANRIVSVNGGEFVDEHWENIGYATWRDDILTLYGEDETTAGLEKIVTLQQSKEDPTTYRLVDVYDSEFVSRIFNGADVGSYFESGFIEFNVADPERVYIKPSSIGFNYLSIGSIIPLYFGDDSYNENYGVMKNNVITFPINSIYLKQDSNYYIGNNSGLCRIIMPGGIVPEVEVKYLNISIDANAQLNAVFEVKMNNDTGKVLFHATEATADLETIVEKMIRGEVETEEIYESGTFNYLLKKQGEFIGVFLPVSQDGSVFGSAVDVPFSTTIAPQVTFDISAVSDETYATINIIPSSSSIQYYWDVMTYSSYNSAIATYGSIEKYSLSLFEDMSMQQGITIEEVLSNNTNSGTVNLLVEDLAPETTYIIYVYCVNMSTGEATSTVQCHEFQTKPLETLDADYKAMLGTWTITSTSSEISKEPISFDVTIKAKKSNSQFYIHGWGGSDQLGYPFPIEGQFQAADNENKARLVIPEQLTNTIISTQYGLAQLGFFGIIYEDEKYNAYGGSGPALVGSLDTSTTGTINPWYDLYDPTIEFVGADLLLYIIEGSREGWLHKISEEIALGPYSMNKKSDSQSTTIGMRTTEMAKYRRDRVIKQNAKSDRLNFVKRHNSVMIH